MSDEVPGVMLYGHGVEAVAEALRQLDPRYVPVDRAAARTGQVPVLRFRHGAEVDAARAAAPGVAWLAVELHRPGVAVGRARDPRLWLNTSKVDPAMAARAIDQPDLVIWYEVINPIPVVTVDGGPAADDYSNLSFVVPDGHRMVAHATRTGGPAPACLPDGAEQVLPSEDLWALARLRATDVCQVCTARHR
jgi:hypothetical protein